MYPTFELRWFYPGDLPPIVQDWFTNSCPGEVFGYKEEREDWYLLPKFPCDYFNLKLRDGRLEIKWRKAELGNIRFGEIGEGNLEQWEKWGCEDLTVNAGMLETEGAWISVKKARSQRQIVLSHSCNIELTQLNVVSESWWSFALEATAEDATVENTITEVAERIVSTHPPLSLSLQSSFAYPAWLSRWI